MSMEHGAWGMAGLQFPHPFGVRVILVVRDPGWNPGDPMFDLRQPLDPLKNPA